MNRRILGLLTAIAFVLAACGPGSLDSAGDRSTGWIGDVPPTEVTASTVFSVTTLAPVESVALSPAAGMVWVNDPLESAVGEGETPEPSRIVRRIWDRSTGLDSYVQAPRADIAAALPGVLFPGAVPSGVEHVTSQLVFRTSGGVLGDGWVAAFGMWTVPPYSEKRETGQQAVLLVGRNPDPDAEAPAPVCEVAAIADALSCSEVVIGDLRGAQAAVDGGVRLQWDQGDYRYQLFYRDPEEATLPALIASSMVELAALEDRAFDAFRAVASAIDGEGPTR